MNLEFVTLDAAR